MQTAVIACGRRPKQNAVKVDGVFCLCVCVYRSIMSTSAMLVWAATMASHVSHLTLYSIRCYSMCCFTLVYMPTPSYT